MNVNYQFHNIYVDITFKVQELLKIVRTITYI